MQDSAANGQQQRLAAAFAQDEVDSIRLGGRVRAIAVAILAVWVAVENADLIRSSWYGGLILLFGVAGLVMSWLARTGRYRSWMKYPGAAFDAALFVFIVISPVPGATGHLPPQMGLSQGLFIYALILLLSAAFIYTPWYALWTGACLALFWALGYLWVANLPDSVLWADVRDSITDTDSIWQAISLPTYVNPYLAVRDIVVVLVGAFIIAMAVRRARSIIVREAATEGRRANLARYFSPDIVDRLADGTDAIGAERRQQVAVLFADIVGFTRLCETASPAAVMSLLRGFQARMERAVFAHGGTLDKYIGDAVMSTFGTLKADASDGEAALRCALDMRAAVADWNRERDAQGLPPVRVGIGVHIGECVVGDVGGARLEFTVIGDAVNVASRLEGMARELDADIVISEALAEAVRGEQQQALLKPFTAHPPVALRGKRDPVGILVYPAGG